MGQQANVTLNSVVYAPGGTNNGLSTWTNRSAGFGSGFSNLTEKFVQPTTGDVVRITFSLAIPIVQAADSDCACAGTLLRTSSVQISVWVPVNSTDAERADLLARIQSLVSTTPFTDAVHLLTPTYG